MIANQTSQTQMTPEFVETPCREPGFNFVSGFREDSIFFDG